MQTRLGSTVVSTHSHGGGFTPGLASTLTLADGSRVFLKAAHRVAQKMSASSYAEEARKLGLLPTDRLPAPRLRWADTDGDWVVLCFEVVDAEPPQRPWVDTELQRCLDSLTEISRVLGDASALPAALELAPLHEEMPTLLHGWDKVAVWQPDWPHREEAAALARALPDLPQGFVHADARDDNFLLPATGPALLCDWNWPGLGPVWIDSATLLVSRYGDLVSDGVSEEDAATDVAGFLATHELTAQVPDDEIDVWFAALCGFMLESDTRPAPTASPHLGTHRRWWAAATWSLLAVRRGWPIPR